MADGPIWLTETDVVDLVSLKDSLTVLEAGLRLEGQGKAHNVSKALGRWDGSAMHCLGAMMPEEGFVGWKTWAITKNGGAVTYELFDANTGALLAVIEAKSLGLLRTSAMTGLGTKWLSPEGADTLALIGAGRQAIAQVAAIHAVRPLKSVLVFSRSEERRNAFAAALSEEFGFDVKAVASVEAAVGEAAITTLITRAEAPFLAAAMLPKDAHLNAIGAILPNAAEFFEDVFKRTGLIAVDSIESVKKSSKEFSDHFGGGDWSAVRSLGSVIAEGRPRPVGTDISLFKSMGMGISDLSVAAEVYRRAIIGGKGKPIGVSQPARIRWS